MIVKRNYGQNIDKEIMPAWYRWHLCNVATDVLLSKKYIAKINRP